MNVIENLGPLALALIATTVFAACLSFVFGPGFLDMMPLGMALATPILLRETLRPVPWAADTAQG